MILTEKEILTKIKNHMFDVGLNLEEMAMDIGICRTTLYSAFKNGKIGGARTKRKMYLYIDRSIDKTYLL